MADFGGHGEGGEGYQIVNRACADGVDDVDE